MEPDRFDQMTLSLASIQSRRGLLGIIAAGLGGGGLGVDADREAAARKRRRRGRKKRKACQNGKTKCGSKCRDLSSNENNCGSCGNACGPDETFQDGNCVADCIPACGGAACGDDDGCGGVCDGACPPGAEVTCTNGVCDCALQGACCFDSECDEFHECRHTEGVGGFCFCKPEWDCSNEVDPTCCGTA